DAPLLEQPHHLPRIALARPRPDRLIARVVVLHPPRRRGVPSILGEIGPGESVAEGAPVIVRVDGDDAPPVLPDAGMGALRGAVGHDTYAGARLGDGRLAAVAWTAAAAGRRRAGAPERAAHARAACPRGTRARDRAAQGAYPCGAWSSARFPRGSGTRPFAV